MVITGWAESNRNWEVCTRPTSDIDVVSIAGDSTRTVTVSFTLNAYQWPLSVEWASSDLSLFTPASAPLQNMTTTSMTIQSTGKAPTFGASRTSGTPLTSGASRSSATSSFHRHSDAALLSGAKVGIGVGAAVGGIAIVLVGFIWFFKRRKARHHDWDAPHASHESYPLYVDGKGELSSEAAQRNPARSTHSPIELDGRVDFEHGAAANGTLTRRRPEQEADTTELDSDWQGNEVSAHDHDSSH